MIRAPAEAGKNSRSAAEGREETAEGRRLKRRKRFTRLATLFSVVVIPAKAGIQCRFFWIPDQPRSRNASGHVGNDKHQSKMTIKYRNLAFASLAGILLFFSFPPLEYFAFAWIALIPLIYLCFSCKPGESFLYGLLAGAVFWLASIFWLTKVSFIGWFFIGLYCSFYLALFALVVSWWHNFMDGNCKVYTFNPGFPIESGMTNLKKTWQKRISFLSFPRRRESRKNIRGFNLIFLFGLPTIWVGLEYARAYFLTGFPWNLLGVSQYTCISLIQCADWGGVYLVSYLIVMGNTAFALLIRACLN